MDRHHDHPELEAVLRQREAARRAQEAAELAGRRIAEPHLRMLSAIRSMAAGFNGAITASHAAPAEYPIPELLESVLRRCSSMGLELTMRPLPDDPTGPIVCVAAMAGTVQVSGYADAELGEALTLTLERLEELEARGENADTLSAHVPF